jgi:RHS repeat-associated protein
MHIPSLYRIIALIALICTAAVVHAGDGGGIVARAVLDGSKHQLAKDSSVTVEDSAFYNAAAIGVDTGYSVQNVITLKINEASNVYLRTAFTAKVRLLISYSNGNDTASMEKEFTINYDTGHTYNARNSFVFYGGRKVTVKVLSVDTGSVVWNVSSVLMVENQLTARPKYNFSCSNTVTNITLNPSANANADELPVSWTAIRGADQYDLEWTYVDASALGRYKKPDGSFDPALIFYHNATRVSTTSNSYNIPLMYDNNGTLFIRVRPVQLGVAKSVLNAIWSSDASPSVMGQYDFTGHERPLNWQSSISFAEEGKRKVVVQYFDGSLRNRQTVTKDNTTNNTIVGETFYDYQGRPAIQVMPAPSLKNVIQYTAGFNVSINNAEYTQRFYDTLGSADTYCGIHAGEMSSDSGASLYYSPKNPNKMIGMNQFIPDAQNYPFTETEYTQDNTGRISRQSGVGPNYQLGSGHETKYYYGTPDQSELDALFGTDVGDNSHYLKNMVRDANGQYSVSYVDMHGRTIATALAGGAPDHMAALPSNVQRVIKENLADSNSRFLQNWSMVNQKSLVVAQTDSFDFHYRLDPSLVTELNCADSPICYTCLYDLEITITDNCNNQLLAGGKAFDTVVHNFSFGQIANTCNPTPLELNFNLQLQEGSYQVTKQLTVNRDAYLYYRDSIYMPNNTCKSMQDFIQEQRDLIAHANTDCVPDCKSCRDSVGTFENFRNKFMTKAGIAATDTASFRTQIETAYTDAIHACDILCGDSTSDDNDIRNAMLQDMTPPYGQYADTTLKNRDKYSIFYVDPQDSVGYVPVYRLDDVHYTNDAGQPDQVYDMQSDLMVDPGSLSVSDFTQLFRSSWAEALLPYHPEYCKLKKLESLHSSNVWDRQMEAIDNFSDAEKAGYLNPTGNSKYRYHSVSANVDPFTQDATQKTKLETKLDNYLTIGSGVTVSMWGMATAMAKCDSGNANCIKYYSTSAATKNNAFDTTQMCEGDLDMAWRFFRQLYLSYKKDLENAFVNDPKGCTPLNEALDKVPTYANLYDDGHTPRFSEDTKTTADKNDLSYILQGTKDAGSTNAAKDRAQDSLNSFYVQNSEALAVQWAAQLSPCQYPDAEVQNTILPLLKGLCKTASDADHPFGASSLPAGRDYMGYHSFVEILTEYNRQHGITNNSSCNPYMITAPAPYDKQPVYSAKPIFVKPSECECQIITNRFNEYLLSGGVDGSFSAYMQRTQGVTMSDADLLQLRQLCKKGMVSTDAGLDCQYLTRPILLPPAFQCNSGESCTSCTVVNELYKSYKETFPNDTPRIGDADDTIQLKRNTLFKNYMNNQLGYSLEAWQYLQFISQCADSSAYTHVVKCVDAHIGSLYRTVSIEAGKLYDIQPTPDGGYIMAGSIMGTSKDGTLVKTDSLGAQIWAMKYGGSASDTLLRVRRTSDNGYIAIGTTHSGHYATGAMWIIKTDNSGHLTWTKSIGFSTPFGEHGYDIIQTSDGGYAALGLYNRHGGHGEFLLSRIQADGTISWVRRFGTSRLQNNSTVCIPGETDSLSYDGVPSYGLLEQDDTLLVSGAAYDPNLGDRYFGVVHKISKSNGNLLRSWHYADGADTTRSCWFRDIYPTENGYMIMVNSAQKLGTVNAQVGVIQLTKAGDVVSYKRFNIPAGSSRMTTSSVFPAADGGYMVAQTGNNSTHITWQKIDAAGTLTGSTETSLSGTQTIGRIAQNTSGLFTMAGNSDQDMLMLVLRPGLSCYDNPVELGATNETATRVPWAIGVDEYVTPQYTDDDLKDYGLYNLTDSTLTCPGAGHCYDIYTGPQLCGKSTPLMPPTEVEYTGTCTDSSFFAVSKGTEYYKVYSDSLTGSFEQKYINKCLEAYHYESFTVTHPKREYHYTLYYYDQAGNVVRTVPPAGVQEIIDTNVLKQVVAARAAHTELVPAHTLVTDYRYNTLNLVVVQHTPDGGTSSFWYDRLGRASVSQNAKQKDSAQYGYTKYDAIARITEVGQVTSSTAMADAISRDEGLLNTWLTNAASTAEQITKTVYDQEYTPIRPFLAARNLRNRVSRIGLYNTAFELSRDSAATSTYYSYDILGNVDSLLQDYQYGEMVTTKNRFKKIAYDFGLVSGKVNQVSYQPGKPDAFYHRYVYDAENRITNVLTSGDSINWDNDAFYQYYDHGPLARTILGEQQVQGINYAYNLQERKKSINPAIYDSIGYTLKEDGSPGSIVGKTAYNVMLNYFNGDYKAISGAMPQDAGIDGTLGNAYRPLYNGNISSMAVNVGALNNPYLYNYQYDQLNRLVAMDAWKKTGADWSVLTPGNDFQERVNYDANGNILSYNRNGNTAIGKQLDMDKLTYSYKTGTNQLDHVNDAVPAGNYDVDVDDQADNNYRYDAIGNLIKDSAEKIASISWTVYGKINRIVKDDGTTIAFTYDFNGNRISKTVKNTLSSTNESTWYVRDAKGGVVSVYESGKTAVNDGHLTQSELHLYGSGRLGLLRRSLDVAYQLGSNPDPSKITMPLLGMGDSLAFVRGNKLFELSNHLGNVLVTLNDKKLGVSSNNTTVDYFSPQVVSAQDYYPFGMLQPGRSVNVGGYRFGFNGKENDNEVKGEGDQQDYGMRIYDPRMGRFLSVDPLTKNYPMLTPYQFASNRPIDGNDLDGLEWAVKTSDPVVVEGVTVVTSDVYLKVKVINNSQKVTKPEDVQKYAEAYKNSIETNYSGVVNETIDGKKYQTIIKTHVILDYTPPPPPEKLMVDDGNGNKREIIAAPEFARLIFDDRVSTVDANGVPHSTPGDTRGQINGFTQRLAITMDGSKVPLKDFKNTTFHEGGHSAGLNHPWELKNDEKLAFPELDQNGADADKNKKTIRGNVMNSAENPDAKYLGQEGKKILDQQRLFIIRKIKDKAKSTVEGLQGQAQEQGQKQGQ